MRAPRVRTIAVFAALTVAAAVTLGACGAGGGSTSSGGGGTASSTRSVDAVTPAGDALTAQEVAGILWMREEEKVARDVYTSLGDRWDLPIFSNIATSEQTHMDAVAGLIEDHGLTDPAATTAPGEFTNPELQALYDSLVVDGSASPTAALTVGATIEDLDLADLAGRATGTPDVAAVYSNLARGSRNHLRAFVRQLAAAGASYTPSHISQAEYDTIVAGATERGRGPGAGS